MVRDIVKPWLRIGQCHKIIDDGFIGNGRHVSTHDLCLLDEVGVVIPVNGITNIRNFRQGGESQAIIRKCNYMPSYLVDGL